MGYKRDTIEENFDMKIFAHRGYSSLYPENTMIAFKKAYEASSDGIELDVQLTKDGEVVIIHDEEVDRTTDKSGLVCEFTLKELKELNAGIKFPNITPFTQIPTFEEYCQWVKTTNLITNVELKTGVIYYQELEKKTIDIIVKYNLEKKVIISSFNHLSLIDTAKYNQELLLAALVEHTGLKNAGYYCKKFGFSFFHPSYKSLNHEMVEECNKHGIQLNVWTVNTQEEIDYCRLLKINGIITNFPKEAREYINSLKEKSELGLV